MTALADVFAGCLELLRRDADRDRYRADPVAYADERLGASLWRKQAEVARALLEPPHRVLVESANGVGKTHLTGAMVAWFFECFDPGECVVTGPRFEQVRDTTFKEIRRHLAGHAGLSPRAPRLWHTPEHYVKGTTASSATAFQGIHSDAVFLVFEECEGVKPEFWEAARGIQQGGEALFWLAIHNPTDLGSHAYAEKLSGQWAVVRISAFEHPNIPAELLGLPAPIPAAVRLGQLQLNLVADPTWGRWIDEAEAGPLDVDLWAPALYGLDPGDAPHGFADATRHHFPRRWWRPGPVGEARILGRYPSQPAYAIFSEAGFDLARSLDWGPDRPDVPQFGCDVARFGDDQTVIHGQLKGVSVHHESYGKRSTAETAGRLKELAREWGPRRNCRPEEVPILVDDSGVGGGVTDQAGEFRFVPIVAQQRARDDNRYPDARSEMLFDLAERMEAGRMGLSRLDASAFQELKRQAMSVKWKMAADGRRAAWPKQKVKDEIRRSPDDLDAMALAYYRPLGGTAPVESVDRDAEPRGSRMPRGAARPFAEIGGGRGSSRTRPR